MSMTLALILSALVILGAGFFLLVWWALVYRPHPRIEGRLRVPGLQARVEVLRDRWGVPHIYAQNEADLWFAQGFVHAQDRLWQMEQLRRLTAGRLSEAVGEEGLPLDRLARVIGFRRTAAAQLERLSPETRTVLEHYVRGVNAFLALYGRRLPLEFTLLGIRPEPWTPVDSLSIVLLLGWALSGNWQEELTRVSLYTRLGPARAAELMPDYPPGNPVILPGEVQAGQAERLLQAYRELQTYIGLTAPGQGSNNWVVSGERSITGKPLLANDPHLAVTMPGPWHLIHLEAAGESPLRLIGAGMAGLPGVLLGHNEHIAWGATAAFPDTADLYVEKRHPQDPTRFLYGDGWEQAQTWEEEIAVRGATPRRQTVTVTRHGPLITDFLAEHERNFPPLALRWVGYDEHNSIEALLALQRARDWEAFCQAAGRHVTPALTLVYADREGNIGLIVAGRVPIRSAGQGLVPAPGYTGTHEWVGYIPADAMPQRFNPPEGQLFSANNRVVPDDYPYWWGIDLYPGYRARRIAELLAARPRHSTRDFQTYQTDTFTHLGRTIAPYFTLIDPKDPWERRAQRALLEWNYRMDTDSMAAVVFELCLYHLLQLVFADKLGPAAADFIGLPRLRPLLGGAFGQQAVTKLAEWLEREECWWFGEGSTGRPRTREELLALALKRAVETLKQEIGDDARRWHWGRLHQILWPHPLGAFRPFRQLLNRGPFPVSGSHTTLNAQLFDYTVPLRTVTVAPLYRMVVDVAQWDRSLFIAAPGQSGLPGHRFYDNLIHLWLEDEMIPMAFSRAKVEESDPLYRLELISSNQ
ncbi:MAG: penicillin acylase family protein [Anaerolineae bacterium]|nr:penicillin acylase family protein [Anaerolineae bacterium]